MDDIKSKVIIVLPAYNAEKTLGKTLEEIPKRFRSDIILVDDASTDNTVDLARLIGTDTKNIFSIGILYCTYPLEKRVCPYK
jgi:glycosyltransferase involved in cell wall biosynthesis